MTVPVQSVVQSFSGDGGTTAFVVSDFTIPLQSDGETPAVLVYYVTSAGVVVGLALGSDYTVVLNTNTVNIVVAPPVDSLVYILANRAAEQPDQFLNQGFLPSNVEAALDYLAWLIQQLLAAIPVIPGPYTVATLPLSQPGQVAWVTDATSGVFGADPVGGGSTITKVWFNPALGWRIG